MSDLFAESMYNGTGPIASGGQLDEDGFPPLFLSLSLSLSLSRHGLTAAQRAKQLLHVGASRSI